MNDVRIPNESPDFTIDIAGLFVSSNGSPIAVEFSNSNPEFAEIRKEGDLLYVTFKTTEEGSTSVGLVAKSDGQQVAEGLTIVLFCHLYMNKMKFPTV